MAKHKEGIIAHLKDCFNTNNVYHIHGKHYILYKRSDFIHVEVQQYTGDNISIVFDTIHGVGRGHSTLKTLLRVHLQDESNSSAYRQAIYN